MFHITSPFSIDPTQFQKENEAMCHNSEYEHLGDNNNPFITCDCDYDPIAGHQGSCTYIQRAIHDEELAMFRLPDHTRECVATNAAEDRIFVNGEWSRRCVENAKEEAWGEAMADPISEARTSPWVKRNLDGAQYAQPRGSEYEG